MPVDKAWRIGVNSVVLDVEAESEKSKTMIFSTEEKCFESPTGNTMCVWLHCILSHSLFSEVKSVSSPMYERMSVELSSCF